MKVQCDNCGKEFSRKKSHVRDKNYCCTDCYAAAKRKDRSSVTCAFCGKQFEKPVHKILEKNFCSRNCHMKYMNAELNPARMTEETRKKLSAARLKPDRKGYKKVNGVHEHRTVAETMLGRKLKRGEVVHHIDRDKSNNNPENLMVFSSQLEHAKWHAEHDPEWGGDRNEVHTP